jgi:hypothetical protein
MLMSQKDYHRTQSILSNDVPTRIIEKVKQ